MPQTREVGRDTIYQALVLTARYLNSRGVQVTAITVGGAVNCLLLRTRQSTHDVDIFGTNLSTPNRILLDEAMQHAIGESSVQLGTDWLNTETQMWMSPTMQRELTEQAIRQNTVVFQQPGLTLLAVPWAYAFSAKVSRLVTLSSQARPYDLDDAVHYLSQIVQQNGGQPVAVDIVEGWANRYNHTTSASFLLETVNRQYERVYRRPGIVQRARSQARRR
jgi:hypothetical protein